MRYCIDYLALNARTVKDSFPLLLIEECFDTLGGSQFFSSLDIYQLRELQLKDHDLKPILMWSELQEDPKEHELFLQSPATKQMRLCRPQLALKHGVSFYKWRKMDKKCLSWLHLNHSTEEVLQLVHDTKSGVHLGRE